MLLAALILAALAAVLHVYIWYLESFAWTGKARAVFGTTRDQAEATRELAYNQGFYNLFLALVTLAGIGYRANGHTQVGNALMVAGAGSMLAAALVLALSSPDKRSAAFKQGLLPALALVALAV